MLSHLAERAEWVGTPPLERAASFRRQGFRQDEEAVTKIYQAQRRRREKRCAWPKGAEQSSDRRSYDEADPKSRAHNPKVLSAPRRRTDVGDVRISRRERSARGTCNRAADEEPSEGRAQ